MAEMESTGQSRFAPCGKLGGFKSFQKDTTRDLSLGTQTRAWAHTVRKSFSAESSIMTTGTRAHLMAPPSRVERDPPCDAFPTHGAHLEGLGALVAHGVATHEHSVLLALHAHGAQQRILHLLKPPLQVERLDVGAAAHQAAICWGAEENRNRE